MNVCDGVKYGRIGFTGILNPDFTLAWSDCPDLFKKIITLKSVLAAKAVGTALFRTFRHCFTKNGIKYCAVFTPISDKYYLCRIYPEDFFLKNAFSEIYSYVHTIKVDSMSTFLDLREFIGTHSGDFPDEEYETFLEEKAASAERIYTFARNILSTFDKSHMCEYVPIEKFLDSTFSHIRMYNAVRKKEVLLETKINAPVARINYSVLESCIYIVVKIFYKILQTGESVTLSVRSDADGSLYMNARHKLTAEFDENDLSRDLRLLRCSMESLGGYAKFYISEDSIVFRSSVPAALSNYVKRIKKVNRRISMEDSDLFELRGLDDIFDSYEKNFVKFRSVREMPDFDLSSVLAGIILGSDDEYEL